MNPRWPSGTVRTLLATDAVTAPTRRALQAKLAKPVVTAPRAFDARAFATLRAVCDRVVPQTGDERVDTAGGLDTRLADDQRDGWRYDVLPPDREAYAAALAGVDETAQAMGGLTFVDLAPLRQDEVLTAVGAGDAPGETWRRLDGRRWFEELRGEVAELYFAHPLGQEVIGYVDMADAPGWRRIGLDEHEEREPERDLAPA